MKDDKYEELKRRMDSINSDWIAGFVLSFAAFAFYALGKWLGWWQ